MMTYPISEKPKDIRLLRHATRDEIICAIHILWERGWQVNLASVREMLGVSEHKQATDARLLHVIGEIQDFRRKYLLYRQGEPFPVSPHWQYQQPENS